MDFNSHKTKIVCTIGPASNSVNILEQMLLAGMNIARLNFSHGTFEDHAKVIKNLREAQRKTGRSLAIMGDLSGPKMRIGQFRKEPVHLKKGDPFTLTTRKIQGSHGQVYISFKKLPDVVKPGDTLHLNDGFIQLEVMTVDGKDVNCKVLVGGELRSRKGLNLPGIKLGIRAFTANDNKCLAFAAAQKLDAVSQSFVESAGDITVLRKACKKLKYNPFIIAKIERVGAVENMDAILEQTDGIMVARGDLGVEVPIEQMAIIQKQLIEKAVFWGRPVIVATQMLESMTEHRKPTRAEATDVANAILDGTDCIMLSGESAMGDYPVESVRMLSKIAAATEPNRRQDGLEQMKKIHAADKNVTLADLISLGVQTILLQTSPPTVMVPTLSGETARSVARFRSNVWITAISTEKQTCQNLQFSYGVHTVHEKKIPKSWGTYTKAYLRAKKIKGQLAVLIEGPSKKHPKNNHQIEIVELD